MKILGFENFEKKLPLKACVTIACTGVTEPIIGTRRVQYLKKTHICLIMNKNVYTDNRHIQKIYNFCPKMPHQFKIHVPFVLCTSCGETTISTSYLRYICLAVYNIAAIYCFHISELYYKTCPFLAKHGQILKCNEIYESSIWLQYCIQPNIYT